MSKNSDYTNIIFLDCESVSIQDGRNYFDNLELQDDLIQLAFIDLNANEFELMVKPNENYFNTEKCPRCNQRKHINPKCHNSIFVYAEDLN